MTDKSYKKPTVTLKNLTDKKRAGIWLYLRRCLCEIRQYNFSKPRRRKKAKDKEISYPLDISVIVCTYNRPEKLKVAVDSLKMQSFDKSRYEILVVNNGGEACRVTNDENVRVVYEPEKGLSNARNTGGRLSKGKYLVYVDDDIYAEKDLLQSIFTAFEKHKNIGIVGGQIILDTPLPRPDIILPGKETLWSEYTVGYKNFRKIRHQYEFPYGANFSISHDAFNLSGGFDTHYGRCGNDYAGGEETALCFKITSLGYKIGIAPHAIVHHRVDENRYTKEHIKNTVRAGIFTTYRLYKDGYSPSVWNKKYIQDRIKILEAEHERLTKNGSDIEIFYKECEKDAFIQLSEEIDKEK